MSTSDLQSRVDAIRWHHAIDLGGGVCTPGLSVATITADKLPPLTGRSVLDIGAWDGYYSFLAEREGASRVVALDHYVWGVDMAARNWYWGECVAKGTFPDHDRDLTDFWQSDLPGRAGFDLAHEALGSRVEVVVGDIATMDIGSLGQFDVVLFLGVLYHLREPLAALERVRRLTKSVAVVETEALALDGRESASLLEFTAGGMGAGYDFGNWYVPTAEALRQLCLAAGFSRVETVVGPPPSASAASPPQKKARWWDRKVASDPEPPSSSRHYRAVVHAFP